MGDDGEGDRPRNEPKASQAAVEIFFVLVGAPRYDRG